MNDATQKTLFSSASGEWETPPGVFKWAEGHCGSFDLDAAATKDNTLCERFFTRAQDSLRQRWIGRVWLNPPYGRDVCNWVEKAAQEYRTGRAKQVMCLLPARTDTKWWHAVIMPFASEVFFIKGRLKFRLAGEALASAPFPSVLVYFSPYRVVVPGSPQVSSVTLRGGDE